MNALFYNVVLFHIANHQHVSVLFTTIHRVSQRILRKHILLYILLVFFKTPWQCSWVHMGHVGD